MYLKVIDRQSERTTVVFSSIHTELGRFRFERQFANIDTNLVLLNCPNNEWYLHGIPSLGDSPSEARKGLASLIKERFPGTKIFGLGSSMGGSGLIQLMAGIATERTLAFCPEIDLFGRASFSRRHYAGPGTNVRDLWSELKDHPNLNLFYGEECEHDLVQLARVRQRTNNKVATFANEPHGVVEAIYLTEGFLPIASALFDGQDLRPKIISRGHVAGSLRTCLSLWDASISRAGQKPILNRLDLMLSETSHDRSYYPQILYWKSILTDSFTEKVEAINEAFLLTKNSLRIASLYFSTTQMDSTEFKKDFISRYGDRYSQNARASTLRKL